ncbi:hypothetical protein NESM_000743000 [Novymonas esmeraldas]|uniref:WW domain-containing protein n=1 Tax=Novymonas esmeraldas TaxID=1808958 RepID=A0AAW0EWI0_9TRYP
MNTGANDSGQVVPPAVSYVPPYRAHAHDYIKEQLATVSYPGLPTSAASRQAPVEPGTAPTPPPRPSVPHGQHRNGPNAAVLPMTPLAVPPPTHREATAPTQQQRLSAKEQAGPLHPPPPSVSPPPPYPAAATTTRQPTVAHVRPLQPEAPQQPAATPAEAAGPVLWQAPAESRYTPLPAPAPHSSPPTPTVVVAKEQQQQHQRPAVACPPASSSPMPASVMPVRLPELSVILARGRLSRVPDLSPDATGEEIYHAFCPDGDRYPSTTDPTRGGGGAVVVASPSLPPPHPQSASSRSSTVSLVAGGGAGGLPQHLELGRGVDTPSTHVDAWAATAAGPAPPQGQLPPGWERRVFHSATFYLDHISREAHEQEPWVVWWGRAGNTDAGSS